MSTWDDRKKAQEEEYFRKQDEAAKAKLREKIRCEHTHGAAAREKLTNFTSGTSPLTGSVTTGADIAGIKIIDCPEEGTLTLTYEDALKLMNASTDTADKWKTFLTPKAE